MPRSAFLLLNRRCRLGGSDLAPVFDRLRAGGLELTVHPTDQPRDIPDILRHHAGAADLVLLAGGDGTMNAAAPVLMDLDRPFGLLPLGTANDLARTLGIPADPPQAAEVIVSGRTVRIDLGMANGRPFFNVASIGVAAHVSGRMTTEGKRRLGILNYAMTTAQALRDVHPFDARISADGQVESVRAVQIAVGNGRYYGGGMAIADEAAIDDARLHLYSLGPQSLLRYAALLPLLRSGRQSAWPGVITMSGQDIRIETDRPLPVNTDGEITTRTPAEFRVLPEVISVLVPQRREAASHAA